MNSAFINELIKRQPELECCRVPLEAALELTAAGFERGGKLFICGNGGSAADALHIAGELCKGFLRRRPLSDGVRQTLRDSSPTVSERMLSSLQWGLPAIPLTGSDALFTAFANDVDAEFVYAQQLLALGRRGDTLLAISTSGNSKNVLAAVALARCMGVETVGMTGLDGGKLGTLADVTIRVPAIETFRIQEYHLPVYHALCAALEAHFEEIGWGNRI
jgi:Phosphoheptose isomerase